MPKHISQAQTNAYAQSIPNEYSAENYKELSAGADQVLSAAANPGSQYSYIRVFATTGTYVAESTISISGFSDVDTNVRTIIIIKTDPTIVLKLKHLDMGLHPQVLSLASGADESIPLGFTGGWTLVQNNNFWFSLTTPLNAT